MKHENVLSTIKALEIELHQFSSRKNVSLVNSLIHESFMEFGRSGRIYCKSDIIESLRLEKDDILIWSQDFTLQNMVANMVLLTYKSAHVMECGKLHRFSLRSSLWLKVKDKWMINFHQGTETSAFVKATNIKA